MKVLVPISNGTEDMEAVIIVDMFRRAGLDVTVAGDADIITCAHGLRLVPDLSIDELDADDVFDAIVLPGGSQGVDHMIQNDTLTRLMPPHHAARRLIGAICAAPMILHEYGFLKGDAAVTSHPGVASDLSVYQYSTDRVVEDGHIVTSRGAGTAFEFALIIIQRLVGDTVATRVATDIVLYE